MSDKIPTIKQIADTLNVSVSTVSRALNDHPRIGKKTRDAIKKLARKLNFEPNPKAIFFKQQKTFLVGVILPGIHEDFFSNAITGIEDAALQHDYNILFGQSRDSLANEKKMVAVMKKQRVDGLIISLSKETDQYEHFLALEALDIPIVYFDRVPPFENVHKVFCDMQKGTEDLVEWLCARGRKRIALINGPDELIATRDRLNGYRQAIAKKKIKIDRRLVEQTDLTEPGTRRAMKNLMALKRPPDAIISFNDYVHLDAARWAQENNIRVNEDVLFVSYSNISITKHAALPPAASLEQYSYRQGFEAMEMLMQILAERGKKEVEKKLFYKKELPGLLVVHP